MLLYQILATSIHGKHNKVTQKQFKTSATTWNGKLELPDGSNSVSDMQDYFDYIFKKHVMIDKPPIPIRIYVNKIENMIILRTKTGYYVQLLCMKR